MSYLKRSALSHCQRVCRLYKKASRNLQATMERYEWRVETTKLRARFDQNKDENDVRKAKLMLLEGEAELKRNWYHSQLAWPYSPGGVAFETDTRPPDGILDTWHPLERAQYPEYFKLRDQRKAEYIRDWEAKYGKP